MQRLFEGSSFDETHETCISQGTVARCLGMVDRIRKQLRNFLQDFAYQKSSRSVDS